MAIVWFRYPLRRYRVQRKLPEVKFWKIASTDRQLLVCIVFRFNKNVIDEHFGSLRLAYVKYYTYQYGSSAIKYGRLT